MADFLGATAAQEVHLSVRSFVHSSPYFENDTMMPGLCLDGVWMVSGGKLVNFDRQFYPPF